jgi:hypothetical protein
MNSIFAPKLLQKQLNTTDEFDASEALSTSGSNTLLTKVEKEALKRGMIYIEDESGTNINV